MHLPGNKSNSKQSHNGPIATLAKVVKHVMASAAEAEIAALCMNAKELLPIRTTLAHPQPTRLALAALAKPGAATSNQRGKSIPGKSQSLKYFFADSFLPVETMKVHLASRR